jgi:GntP family gluconate:H+ symporter
MNPFLILAIGMAIVVGGILFLRLHAFLALILAALAVAAITSPQVVEQFYLAEGMAAGEAHELAGKLFVFRVTEGFGAGAAKIGILIAMAAIIGKCLLDSGAAERIVAWIRDVCGEKHTPVAFSVSAFTLAIPVFFDTVFYLLMPLGKAMRLRTGKDYLLYILAIVAGGTMAHSLVPPTPGPIFVAVELGIEIGAMMLGGLVVGVFTVTAGYAYAVWANKRWVIPLRDTEGMEEGLAEDPETTQHLPPLWLALTPIILPVVLIAGQTLAKVNGIDFPALRILGDQNIALMISAAISLLMLARVKRKSLKDLANPVQDALASGGVIILITAAGSAFGVTLRQTGITGALQGALPDSQLLLLVMAFGITAVMRTAQGSATVAMVTAVGIVGPLIQGIDLAYHPVYVALAIGCGSKPISWMNDSGFWIIGRLTGMTEVETLRTVTVMLLVMGLTGLAVILLGAAFVPLV